MKQLYSTPLRDFSLIKVTEKEAELVLSCNNTIIDFVALGTFCLYRSITGYDENFLKIATADFSNRDSGTTAYVGNEVISIPYDSFIIPACEYVTTIANHIAEKDCVNNMILGPMIQSALSLYAQGKDIGMGLEPHVSSMLRGILPIEWDINNTLEAQRVAYQLILKMFEILVMPVCW